MPFNHRYDPYAWVSLPRCLDNRFTSVIVEDWNVVVRECEEGASAKYTGLLRKLRSVDADYVLCG